MTVSHVRYLVLVLLLVIGINYAASPIAVVVKARGTAMLENPGTKKQVHIRRGTRIYDGSKIRTKAKSFVAIKFTDDGSLVRIRPNSSCTINGKREQASVAKNIFIEVGMLFSKVFKQKSPFRISTPTSVASVKGTAFWVKQLFKAGTYYYGEEGVVEVSNQRGSALLKGGETGYVASSNSKPVVRRSRQGEKPLLEDEEMHIDEFDFEFENEDGQIKNLRFKVKTKK